MHYTQNQPNQYGKVTWDKNDVKTIHPGWSDKRCEEFLAENEEDLYTEMLDAGWTLLVERAKGESDAS